MRWRHVVNGKDERRKKIMDRLMQVQMNEGWMRDTQVDQ